VGKDWWGSARALFAAGFRAGDIVHNSFAYHLTPGGFILEAGWLDRPASEKRQGRKSRGVGHQRCSGRYGDLAPA
jgi:hypothetical protein